MVIVGSRRASFALIRSFNYISSNFFGNLSHRIFRFLIHWKTHFIFRVLLWNVWFQWSFLSVSVLFEILPRLQILFVFVNFGEFSAHPRSFELLDLLLLLTRFLNHILLWIIWRLFHLITYFLIPCCSLCLRNSLFVRIAWARPFLLHFVSLRNHSRWHFVLRFGQCLKELSRSKRLNFLFSGFCGLSFFVFLLSLGCKFKPNFLHFKNFRIFSSPFLNCNTVNLFLKELFQGWQVVF